VNTGCPGPVRQTQEDDDGPEGEDDEAACPGDGGRFGGWKIGF
jgi:hypothetical protein